MPVSERNPTTVESSADPAIVQLPAPQVKERVTAGVPGMPALFLASASLIAGLTLLARAASGGARAGEGLGVVLLVLGGIAVSGLTQVAPGEARVLQLFGRYHGTIRTAGLRWVNPATRRRKISTRVRNQETALAKVNDADGNPIEIAAVVVWQVADTAQAVYEVDDLPSFVTFQSETAVRHIATSYPYEARDRGAISLRDSAREVTGKLSAELGARVAAAGVRVIESRLTRLSYAPEVAAAMLRRQQAEAVVAARQRIVEGAVGMVEMALARLDELDIVVLDDERKATMVSNLLVVLCSDQATQPVVNTGSLYT
ncbi:MAG: SPFH domain-containing protein [Candidatus Dormibacteraeota bacterium]|nr:SPFH domain-containing protein [Candidatus Dormibacteraeota bacterium]